MEDSRKNLLAKRRKLRKFGSVSTNITAKYDGKIIFGIIAKRIIQFVWKNGYIDESIQETGMPQIPGCFDRTYFIWEEIRNAKETISTTAVDSQPLKVKGYDISVTKNYCITISIQIISSIHKIILKIQQILGSPELKYHYHFCIGKKSVQFLRYSQFQRPMTRLAAPIFDRAHPINFLSAFNFCESVSTCKKSVYSISLFIRYSEFQSPVT